MTTELSPLDGVREHTAFYEVVDGVCVAEAQTVLNWFTRDWATQEPVRPTDQWLKGQGYYGLIEAECPEINPRVERVAEAPLDQWAVDDEEGTVTRTYIVTPLTAEEQQKQVEAAWESLRHQRFVLLLRSDHTQLADSASWVQNLDQWLAYRQALRDLPAVTSDPFNPTWPEAPSA